MTRVPDVVVFFFELGAESVLLTLAVTTVGGLVAIRTVFDA